MRYHIYFLLSLQKRLYMSSTFCKCTATHSQHPNRVGQLSPKALSHRYTCVGEPIEVGRSRFIIGAVVDSYYASNLPLLPLQQEYQFCISSSSAPTLGDLQLHSFDVTVACNVWHLCYPVMSEKLNPWLS